MRVSLELAVAHRDQLGRARYCLGETQVVPYDALRGLLAARRRGIGSLLLFKTRGLGLPREGLLCTLARA
jgi:hypothetical protein